MAPSDSRLPSSPRSSRGAALGAAHHAAASVRTPGPRGLGGSPTGPRRRRLVPGRSRRSERPPSKTCLRRTAQAASRSSRPCRASRAANTWAGPPASPAREQPCRRLFTPPADDHDQLVLANKSPMVINDHGQGPGTCDMTATGERTSSLVDRRRLSRISAASEAATLRHRHQWNGVVVGHGRTSTATSGPSSPGRRQIKDLGTLGGPRPGHGRHRQRRHRRLLAHRGQQPPCFVYKAPDDRARLGDVESYATAKRSGMT